ARQRRPDHRLQRRRGHPDQVLAPPPRGGPAPGPARRSGASDARHPRGLTVPELVAGEDGRVRCGWTGTDPEYRRYHDEEWGVPLHGDRELFEKISLEAFQAGLSWITILRRRPAFRAAFDGFGIE